MEKQAAIEPVTKTLPANEPTNEAAPTAGVEYDVTVKRSDLWLMLHTTFRFVRGRLSTIPCEAIDLFERYAMHLLPKERKLIVEEIKRDIACLEHHGLTLGMACDHERWREFVRRYDRE